MSEPLLRTIDPSVILSEMGATASDAEAMRVARDIVHDVRTGGDEAIHRWADRFGERRPDESIVIDREELDRVRDRLNIDDRRVLERTRDRIVTFATKQKACLRPLETAVPGGMAGHTFEPIERVACYVPGGRHPLVSTALMTAATARAAGCARVVIASPNPPDIMLAAASIAGADALFAIGGAQAIAALGYGTDTIDPVDLIVGPGSRWVTAAKRIVAGDVAIDMLAGPSELLVLADASADPALVAADLLAQAEHDPDARPMFVTTSPPSVDAVNTELKGQLAALSTRAVAERALQNGFACVAQSEAQAVALANHIAAEHLQIVTIDPERIAPQIRHAGALFIGSASAEVLGDFGAGPNHTLPTGRTARFEGGLSVIHFLRLRTWLRIDDLNSAGRLLDDAHRLGQIEGLPAHAASALRRQV